MVVGLYTVYDKVAGEAGPIFQAKNDQVAVRATSNMLLENKVDFIDDYVLYRVGSFNTELNLIEDAEKHIVGYEEFQYLAGGVENGQNI